MKDTIKNSIIGAFAIFGFVALISSSNNAPTVAQETKQVFSIHTAGESSAYKINRETGEVWVYNSTGRYWKTKESVPK